ncbi:hypothetical protein DFP72DRAFT_901896 [Ephemerocybe angulata]|uniref:BTB domain-containing protein n=1 Tax=Ephemerocybe angulata TaxID=980116 RepID=A0A8H6M3S5_9AGAR|nr:hypothetical protein DFP72DRAFT_901896 [Tulosesus angulatus]
MMISLMWRSRGTRMLNAAVCLSATTMDCSDGLLLAETEPSLSRLAAYPFDHPQGDLILRSSDTPPVDFRVFKLLLSLSSPFFSTLLTLPQPTSPLLSPRAAAQTDDELPVIQMSEDEATLRVLLGFCYPISTHEVPHFTSLTELQSVAEAALKFEMEGVVRYIRHKELVSPRFVEAQPVRVFAIAYLHSWMEEARLAARYTLRHPMPGPYGEELERISAGAYHRLQEYHQLCGEAASSRASIQESMAISGFDDSDRWVWLECRSCAPMSTGSGRRWSTPFISPSRSGGPRNWWSEWIKAIARLLRSRPRGEAVRDYDLMKRALAEADLCPVCSLRARDDLESFIQILSVEVEKAISSVTFPTLTPL